MHEQNVNRQKQTHGSPYVISFSTQNDLTRLKENQRAGENYAKTTQYGLKRAHINKKMQNNHAENY